MCFDDKEEILTWAGIGLFTGAWAIFFAVLGSWLGVITFSYWALQSLGLAALIYCEGKKNNVYQNLRRKRLCPAQD